MKPVITVLMPVYNGEKYLAEAIDSILCQTFRDFEFLIIDDGSTDKTGELLKQYAESDKRIRLIHHAENVGLVKTLNEGLRAATGDWIARMDADDISLPTRLLAQLSFMHQNPTVTVVGSRYEVMDEHGMRLMISNTICDTPLLKWKTMFKPPVAHSSAFFNKNRIIAIGGYNPQAAYVEDYDLWVRTYISGGTISNLNDVHLRYRKHQTSVSRINARKQHKNGEKVQEAFIKYYNQSLTSEDIHRFIQKPHLSLVILPNYIAYRRMWRSLYQSFVEKESYHLSVSPIPFIQYLHQGLLNLITLSQ